jgi:hypothetical protein
MSNVKDLNGWKTVDNAPEEGSRILLWYQGEVYVAWYEEYEKQYWHITSPNSSCWYSIHEKYPVNTYWQELPPSPIFATSCIDIRGVPGLDQIPSYAM